ncbi:MAG: DUF2782 domain-containing protein [Pseudomonadota bacterium]
MDTKALFAVLLAVGLCTAASAQDPAEPPPPVDAPEPPELTERAPAPIPPKVRAGEQIDDPSVIIRTDEKGQIIEEYMQNGRLYMVRITPVNAPAYYLFDMDGDGLFEDLNPQSPIRPVHWKVAEWK